MDDPLVVKMIRQTLVNYRILSESDVLVVSGDHVRLRDNSSHRLWVSDGEEWAYSKDVTWHVKSYSDITTWHSDEYFFHFIAYFTPSNYLWLRNILMHDPKFSTDEYFLGVLVQVLNDNHFDTYYANIPSTDSLTKIFRWDNRLEEHMGDFGLGLWPKSKFGIMNAMINLKYIDHHLHQIEVCENIYVVMYNLRYFFNYQTAKNNFGMMLNLEWSYNAGDDAMTLKYAQVW